MHAINTIARGKGCIRIQIKKHILSAFESDDVKRRKKER